ncbi:MAG: putative metal-binding motif-containing protein [Nanoarchaeota archaeon]|nr:putative metal-binding motif-containing protein [Nanoarchaeota archaeon]
MKKRAQAAMEYLLVGSLVTLIIIPTMYVFYGYSQTSNEEVKQSQLNKVGTDIVDIAEQVYYLGEPSRVTIDAAMPEGIMGMEVWKNQEVVFFLNDGSEVSFKSKVNITTSKPCIGRCYGNFTERFHSPGLKSIIIEAKKDHVFIREAGDNQTEQEPIEEDKFYCDEDDDNHYAIESSFSCPSGRSDTEQGDDCNDNDDEMFPGNPEVCDGKDNNCDGSTDEGFTNENCKYVCLANLYKWAGNGDPLNCCGNGAGEGSPYQPSETTCYDGNDNDCNSLTDCDDSSCDGLICTEDGKSECQGGVCKAVSEYCLTPEDDDDDTLTNCEDTDDCPLGASCCPVGETCEEGTMTCQDTVYGPQCFPT